MAGVVKVIRVVRVRVILSEILKWQRFLKVICRFPKVICRFLKVIFTRGRYRAARAAKKGQQFVVAKRPKPGWRGLRVV